MSLYHVNKNQKNTTGFTIVELLIVIVVIGILAAITIVAYNGVQARANNTKLDSLAKEIADKAEVYAADHDGLYPTWTQFIAIPTTGEPTTHLLSQAAKDVRIYSQINPSAPSITPGKIQYCGNANGYTVTSYDYTTKMAATSKARKGGTPPSFIFPSTACDN